MAVRRIISGVSSLRFGKTYNISVHHTNVCRWEIMFVAATQAWRRSWYADKEHHLYLGTNFRQDQRSMRFAFHLVRGDATNSMKLKGKYHTTEIKTQYFDMETTNETSWHELMQSVDALRSIGDILRVTGGSARDTYAMYEKQIRSCGCPVWVRPDDILDKAASLQRYDNVTVSITYFFGTDSGSDEAKAKSQASAAAAEDMGLYVIGCVCLLHQYHLMVRRSLKFADKLCEALRPAMNGARKYFSTLVKIIHCWRDASKNIFHRWTQLYGAADAVKYGKRRPAQAISGRWGSVEQAESHILRAPTEHLRAVLGPFMPIKPPPKPQSAAALPAPATLPSQGNQLGEVGDSIEVA